MAFGDSQKKASNGTNAVQTPYLRLRPGEFSIRILDDEETGYWRYWLEVNVNGKKEGRPVICGFDNPIVRRMKESGLDKKDQAYLRPSMRFLVNVLDRTPVVIMDDVVVYPNVDGNYVHGGKTLDAPPTPRNIVRIWEFGRQALEELMTLNGRMKSRANIRKNLTLQETDLLLIVNGEGRDRTIKIMQGYDEAPLNIPVARYDLASLVRPMPDAAVEALLNGEEYNAVLESFKLIPEYATLP